MEALIPYAAQLGQYALRRWLPTRGRGRARARRGRRTSGARSSRAGTSSRVPTRSIMQGSFTGTIRQYYSVPADTSFYKTLSINSLLADAFVGLKTQFGECRVNSVRVYYTPSAPTSTPSVYAAALIDSTDVSGKTLSYGQVLALPGSTSRKAWQGCGLHWKWTEPSDAEFSAVTYDKPLCIIYVATPSTVKIIEGDIVVDASVTLRSLGVTLGHPLHRMISENVWRSDDLVKARELIDESLLCHME